jgi:hypothetical protein
MDRVVLASQDGLEVSLVLEHDSNLWYDFIKSTIKTCAQLILRQPRDADILTCTQTSSKRILGFAIVRRIDKRATTLKVAHLCASVPKQCIGLILFKGIVEYAMKYGFSEIWLESTPEAISFYENIGGAHHTPSGVDANPDFYEGMFWSDLRQTSTHIQSVLNDCHPEATLYAAIQDMYTEYLKHATLTFNERWWLEKMKTNTVKDAPASLQLKLAQMHDVTELGGKRKRRRRHSVRRSTLKTLKTKSRSRRSVKRKRR